MSNSAAGDRTAPEALVLDLDGYEGPIDLLLALARTQKVDLARISILAVADQFLDFIAQRQPFDLAHAADYLVMAAVLAYLKSLLLLAPSAEEPAAEALAETLRHRLALLEAMQAAGRRLVARPLAGRDFFLRSALEEAGAVAALQRQASLHDLLQSYGEVRRRRSAGTMVIPPSPYHAIDEALRRLQRLLGRAAHWLELASFLPTATGGEEFRRSALASTFAAALEMARNGRAELRQEQAFGPIWLRRSAAKTAAVVGTVAPR